MIAEWFLQLPRRTKQLLIGSVDCVALLIALWSALALRLGDWQLEVGHYWPAFVACLASVPAFGSLGLYRQVTRYSGDFTMLLVAKGAACGAVAVMGTAYIASLPLFPRSVPAIFWLVAMFYVAGNRFAFRACMRWLTAGGANRIPVIIYGAGRRGVELARFLVDEGKYDPVAFLDEDERLQKRVIDGVGVYPLKDLAVLQGKARAKEVLVALSSAKPGKRAEILEFLEPFTLPVRFVPNVSDLDNARNLRTPDLLGRTEVAPHPHLLRKSVAGRRVMVTGAGGSIGSELCQQIVRQSPRQLVLLDHSELALYKVKRTLDRICAEEGLDVSIAEVLGSVTNRTFLRHSLGRFKVGTLYHVAAYKHVSLVEKNLVEGVRNNVLGTLYTAEEALRAEVRDFILISTDKAVRTSSVMGASKRLAEMALQALQQHFQRTCFSIVRFGNVLYSSGSVAPLFLEQIKQGGPITVTHREATRYFMTIREAAELVMQAASMAQGGDVFLLDMGNPIKIYDLATDMVRSMGLSVKSEANPNGDIEIRITELGPGENLHENLLVGEEVAGTDHPKIMRAEERFLTWPELRRALGLLERACDACQQDAVRGLILGLINEEDRQTLMDAVGFEPAEVLPLHDGRRRPDSGGRLRGSDAPGGS